MTDHRHAYRRIRLVRARGVWARLRGLLGRARPLGWRTGLWLSPCWAVHTFGMQYPIDVAFIGRDGCVLCLIRHLVPGRIAFFWGAASVIELRANPMDSSLRYRRRLHIALRKARDCRMLLSWRKPRGC